MRIILVLPIMLVSMATFAATDVNDYVAQLRETIQPCWSMADEIDLQQRLGNVDASTDANNPSNIIANVGKVNACVSDAQDKGAEIYKVFSSGIKNKSIRVDARNVFSAWLAYTKTVHILDPDDRLKANNEETALNEAESTLQTDALTQ